MHATVDEARLRALMAESADLHADAARATRRAGRAAVLAGDADVAVLQTAAALENLAVATYGAALGLPFVRDGNPLVRTFATTTRAQHADHATAFNAAAVRAGGAARTDPDARYLAVVRAALPGLRSVADVVRLVAGVEDVAAQTYVADASRAGTAALRTLLVSVAGVEAQHQAVLLAIGALLAADLPDEVRLGPDAARLPAAVGGAPFPAAFVPTTRASPSTEGAAR